MMDVEDFDGVLGHAIENDVGIAAEWRRADPGTA
jgi:hypothetical protein